MIKDRRSCSMRNLLQILKTKRDILYFWLHAARHYRGGQEASRTMNQQSIRHVRPWNSQVSIEEYLEGVDVMETQQTHKNSRKQEITWISQRSTITERSWSAPSRTGSTKSACTNKETRITTETNTRSYNPTNEEAATT